MLLQLGYTQWLLSTGYCWCQWNHRVLDQWSVVNICIVVGDTRLHMILWLPMVICQLWCRVVCFISPLGLVWGSLWFVISTTDCVELTRLLTASYLISTSISTSELVNAGDVCECSYPWLDWGYDSGNDSGKWVVPGRQRQWLIEVEDVFINGLTVPTCINQLFCA